MKPKVIVTIEDGKVQAILTDVPTDVLVLNYDVEAEDPKAMNLIFGEDEIVYPAECKFEETKANAKFVSLMFSVIEKHKAGETIKLHEKMLDSLFYRVLNEEEEQQFRKWARDNYKKGEIILELWHPIVKDECNKINEE